MSNENKIVGTICLVFFVIIAFLFWKGPATPAQTPVKNAELLVRPTSHMTGTIGAKVTMVEFGDYQCPACATVNGEIEKVIEKYKGNPDFNFAFRNFPLSQHQNALAAAEAAEAAGAQGKYFEMNATLYKNQLEWGETADPSSFFVKYATVLGLDMTKFNTETKAEKFASVIQADTQDGNGLLIDHTPTVFINGIEQADLSSVTVISKIDELLKK